MDPKELIAALGVFADPNASDEDKAAALEKLTAHFNSLLDASEATAAEAASETTETETEGASAASGDESEADKPSQEMASAIAKIAALESRLAKMEKASAAGNAPRAKTPTVLPRTVAVLTDPVAKMIDNAVAASRRNAGK